MSEKHFSIDCDPDGLREVAHRMGTLKDHLDTKAGTVKGTPGEIGDGWTGDAATSIKTEMTGLGTHMGGFADKLQPVIAGLRSLARDYDEALARLPGLNKKWNQAQTDYDNAVSAADNQRQRTLDELQKDGPVNGGIRNELDDVRSGQVSEAAGARQTAQHNLEIDFGYMVQHLGMRTRALADTLADSGPIPISSDQLANWRATGDAGLDHSGITATLKLTGDREAQELEEEIALLHSQAREEVKADLEDLNEALDDGDPEAIQDALDEIGANADDPIYSQELVDELGADGVQDLYVKINDNLTNSTLYMEDLWPHLQGFNDAIANGISQKNDEEMAEFLEAFMEKDYGPKTWALIASSEYADGRVNAAAIAYYSEVYNASLSNMGGMPGLFPQVFNYAYGDNDMLDQWDANSSGSDLADILEEASKEHRDDLMFRLLNVQVDGGTMNEDDFQHIASLYGEMLVALKDRHLDALQDSVGARPDLLMEMLEWRNRNLGNPQYTDPIAPYLAELVNDPEWALWYLNNARDGFVPASTFKDLIDESGTKPEDLIASMTTYQIQRGDNPEQVATNLGLLMRQQDLLGDDIKWGGVLKSVAESLVSAGAKTPLTGPTLGVFNALLSEIQRLEKADQDLDGAMTKNAVQEVFAFSIYTQVHGGPPPGFEEFVERENLGDNDRAVNLYIQHLEEQGGPVWHEIEKYITNIDESRDES